MGALTGLQATRLAVLSGILMAVGSLLPWLELRTGLGTVSAAGTEGDGLATLATGVIAALSGFVALEAPSAGKRYAVGIAGLVGLLVGGYHVLNLPGTEVAGVSLKANAGVGLWTVIVGSALALLAAFRMPAPRPEPSDERKAPITSQPRSRQFFVGLLGIGIALIVWSILRR